MSCPICRHAMQKINRSECVWCPQCGTLAGVNPITGKTLAQVPSLVDRCRDFTASHSVSLQGVFPKWEEIWEALAESFTETEDRK